jgi:ketosteroid isomerase-like protein
MFNFKKFSIVLAGFLALATLAPSAWSAGGTAADESTIRAASKTWADAYNAGDIDRIVALYADDGIIMPPNAPAASGHAAMHAFLTQDAGEAKAAGLTLHLADGGAGASGNLGWHAGTYTMTNAAGETVDSGKWVETWQKTAGKWLMIRDIWNSDLPAAAPAAE